jgi:uncharacterized protein (UPF0333 family)
MEFKLILLALVISVAYYIIKFYSLAATDPGKVSISVISNSEQNIRHNYEKYGILGIIGMVGVIIVIMSRFFDSFYWVKRITG